MSDIVVRTSEEGVLEALGRASADGRVDSHDFTDRWTGALMALEATAQAAEGLALLTSSEGDFAGALAVMRAARHGDRVWPPLVWLRERRATARTEPAPDGPGVGRLLKALEDGR